MRVCVYAYVANGSSQAERQMLYFTISFTFHTNLTMPELGRENIIEI